MTIIGLKLSGSFLDVIAKVDDSMVDKLKRFDFDVVDLKAAFVIQLQQVQGDKGMGMAPNLSPINIFTRDLKESVVTLKKSDILFFFDIDENLENFYRESIGDITVSSQKVIMP